jgi:hypothetical protein
LVPKSERALFEMNVITSFLAQQDRWSKLQNRGLI